MSVITTVRGLLLLVAAIIGQLCVANQNAMAAQPQQPPDCNAPEFHQFDFWIGDWEVFDAKGNKVGTNSIQPIINACALHENWVGKSGIPGTSINFYDKNKKQWHQTWISAFGALYLNGGLDGKVMRLQGKQTNAKGEMTLQEITWTPLADGRVKQHWRASKDNGKNWTDVFVGFYQRKESTK